MDLKTRRLKKHLTQKQVSEAVNITESGYCLIENGQRNPSVETAKAIAKVLGFNWTRFFEEEEKQ